jgi:excisionase family DNA binding protein
MIDDHPFCRGPVTMPTKFPRDPAAAQSASKRKDFYTVAELAIRWSLSERHIRRLIDNGELVVHRFGRAVRVSAANATLFEASRAGVL